MKYFLETDNGKIMEFYSILRRYIASPRVFVSNVTERIYTNQSIPTTSTTTIIRNKNYVFIISPIPKIMALRPGSDCLLSLITRNSTIKATKIINIWEED